MLYACAWSPTQCVIYKYSLFQDPFDDISVNVKKQLSNNQKFELGGGLQKLNIDHFVKELLECILLYFKHVPKEQLHWP